VLNARLHPGGWAPSRGPVALRDDAAVTLPHVSLPGPPRGPSHRRYCLEHTFTRDRSFDTYARPGRLVLVGDLTRADRLVSEAHPRV